MGIETVSEQNSYQRDTQHSCSFGSDAVPFAHQHPKGGLWPPLVFGLCGHNLGATDVRSSSVLVRGNDKQERLPDWETILGGNG